MAERLQKILSQWGVASRRQAEQMILEGRVRLNGAIAQPGQKANLEQDWIEVDGQPIQPHDRPQFIYLLLNKPVGVVSTCFDPQNRPTVLDLLPPALHQNTGLHPVGRLDFASSGALILTNDGALTFCLTHPRHTIPKTYHVWVEGRPSRATLDQWRQGIMLAGQLTQPAQVSILDTAQPEQPSSSQPSSSQTLLEVVLWEGRNRQIRRVAEQLGHPVRRLHRVAIGSIRLGSVPKGQYRILGEAAVESLKTQANGTRPPLPNLEIGERVISEATQKL